MHARINRYSMATGSGVVTNYSKKIFELRKENWHDKKMLPSAGMYIECRVDDHGNILDAHSSAYQDFKEDSWVKEIDFWKTDTDEELRTLEQDRQNKSAEEIFNKTDYLTMTSIEVTTSTDECLNSYFHPEFLVLFNAQEDLEEIPPNKVLNYLIVRQFVTKAMDYLMFCDKNITQDVFANELQKLSMLEYCYKGLMTSTKLKPESIYDEVFLDKQLHYKGAIKAILGIKERIIQLKNKGKFCTSEIRKLRMKIEVEKAKDPTLLPKLETQKQILAKSNEDIKVFSECQERLENLTKDYKKKHFDEFAKRLSEIHDELLDKTRAVLNLVCTDLDNKIWKIGMSSISVKNNFLKQVESPYCSMTFFQQYLKRLDKNKLADSQKSGYNYFMRYKKENEKMFLICTTNEKLELTLKVQIMSKSKDYSVVVVRTDGEFISTIDRQAFELGYIDPFVRGNPKQMIEDAKRSKLNKTTRFVIIPPQQVQVLAARS